MRFLPEGWMPPWASGSLFLLALALCLTTGLSCHDDGGCPSGVLCECHDGTDCYLGCADGHDCHARDKKHAQNRHFSQCSGEHVRLTISG
jgi:hypothetical protein